MSKKVEKNTPAWHKKHTYLWIPVNGFLFPWNAICDLKTAMEIKMIIYEKNPAAE